MNLPKITVLVAVSLLGWASVAAADGDPERGKVLAETCLGCHGVNGYYNVYPTYRVPRLGGQNAKYIESALKAYKTGAREHGSMQANATDLSDQDMADIGAFLESHGK